MDNNNKLDEFMKDEEERDIRIFKELEELNAKIAAQDSKINTFIIKDETSIEEYNEESTDKIDNLYKHCNLACGLAVVSLIVSIISFIIAICK